MKKKTTNKSLKIICSWLIVFSVLFSNISGFGFYEIVQAEAQKIAEQDPINKKIDNPLVSAEELKNTDFSPKRLLIQTEDPEIFTDSTRQIGSYNNMYLTEFDSEEMTENAYLYYTGKADSVSVDIPFSICEKDESSQNTEENKKSDDKSQTESTDEKEDKEEIEEIEKEKENEKKDSNDKKDTTDQNSKQKKSDEEKKYSDKAHKEGNSKDASSTELKEEEATEVPDDDIPAESEENELETDKEITPNSFIRLNSLLDSESSDDKETFDIALIDTGVNETKNAPVAKSVSLIEDEDSDDKNGHGSKMNEYIHKTNPDIRVLSIKAFDENGNSSASSIYAAFCYAVSQKVKVINLSATAYSETGNDAIEEIVSLAVKKGITVVVSAGNEGKDTKNQIPANMKDVLVIGSCNEKGEIQEFTNTGDTLDYNLVSDSTSEASALMSGWIVAHEEWEKVLAEDINKKLIYDKSYVVSDGKEELSKENQEEDSSQKEEETSKEKVAENNDSTENPNAESSADTSTEKKKKEAEKKVLVSTGKDYRITVTYTSDARIPEGSSLSVHEITEDKRDYDNYIKEAEESVEWKNPDIRLFDIKILDKNGEKVDIKALVDVDIHLEDKEKETQILHFGSEEKEIIENVETKENKDGHSVTFQAPGFSVYAVIEAPEPLDDFGYQMVSSLDDLAEKGAEGVYIRHPNGYYFTDEIVQINSSRTGIRKTTPSTSTSGNASGAVKYYFEPQGNTGNKYKVYCNTNGGKLYVKQSGNSLNLVSEADASVFTISDFPNAEKTFRILGTNNYYWNMQGGNNGSAFAAYNNATDTNARIQFEYYRDIPDDPYNLDGKTYGIVHHKGEITATSMEAKEVTNSTSCLVGEKMTIRPDVLNNDGLLILSSEDDITQWTFHNIEKDKYYITAEVEGVTKYLTITGNNITLETVPDPVNSQIMAVPGSGTHAGKWHFGVGGRNLFLPNGDNTYFNTNSGNSDYSWMSLVETSVLTNDDFGTYSAKKVSISDNTKVYDKQKVIIYTRIWDDVNKKYNFYVLDYDGTLKPCIDKGDMIELYGTKVNTFLWEFIEHTNGDGTPNYYYDLKNVQYGNYIAPQITDNQIVSDNPIGINLNGRKNGNGYSPIVAWDDNNYCYAGLETHEGKVQVAHFSDADDFYFAIVSDSDDPQEELTTVNTLDNAEYGISMKMIDYNNVIENQNGVPDPKGRDRLQNSILGYGVMENAKNGFLQTGLEDDGYPKTDASKTGKPEASLSALYNGATDVNHLFMESIYRESGYFEFDSTQTFAHLNADGNFTVYDQLGTLNDYPTATGSHGQFLPYNDLTPGVFAPITNKTNVLAQELPDTDPRKGEKLYNVGNRSDVDYFFGMEMSASFTQTTDGLDAWNHDIIFEFSGDDDFWLYVDGELVLDLGGVHSALTGSINFRTGIVTTTRPISLNGGNRSTYTLREIFEYNYKKRHPGASNAEVNAYLNGIFKNGGTVFKDFSKHTMKMFYMERGAGASNLKMRFNLSSVKPGTVVLNKKLSGTSNPTNNLINIPYQIYYKRESDPDYQLLREKTGNVYNAYYRNSNIPVEFKDSFTPHGGNTAYQNVFFLNPGQSAVIDLPDDTVSYYFKECAVDPNIYDTVSANGVPLTGTATPNIINGIARNDYSSTPASMLETPEVNYDNHIKEGAMRTLTLKKVLYDSDGERVLTKADDSTLFSFRLYLDDENAQTLSPANMYPYYIKDPEGYYCKWDATAQEFVPVLIESHKVNDYETLDNYLQNLTSAEKAKIVFLTSMNGSISKIPSEYSVEVRDLVIGTQYKFLERDDEIPRGYTLRLEDGYTRTDGQEIKYGTTPVSDTMMANKDPHYDVRNQKGWGLTINKVWTDKDFISTRADTYFATYLYRSGNLSLVNGTVRRLAYPETSIYYFFGNLQQGIPFSSYVIREVKLTGNISVNADNVVTGYDTITPVEDGSSININGTAFGSETPSTFSYKVHYEQGVQSVHNENVRTDTVINSRPGIRIKKADWNWNPLANAVFTIKTADGTNIAGETYTSDSNGLVTTAYMNPGDYKLKEIASPEGYIVLDSEVNLHVASDGSVTLDNISSDYYTITSEDDMPVITIRNKTSSLQFKKIDSETNEPLEGVHFMLYRQVTDSSGNKRKDYLPIDGYYDIVTDQNGILPGLNMSLGVGTYYLVEKAPLDGYLPLEEDLCFSIRNDGSVTIESGGDSSWIQTENIDGDFAYSLNIPNTVPDIHFGTVKVIKKSMHTGLPMAGVTFRISSDTTEITKVTDENGEIEFEELEPGDYTLVETETVEGYNILKDQIKIQLPLVVPRNESAGYNLDEAVYNRVTDCYEFYNLTITVKDSMILELPKSGAIEGPMWILFILGLAMVLGGTFFFGYKKRKLN